MSSATLTSADLKGQGNALFAAKNFAEAEIKYTKAIAATDEAADPKGLAVLYSNRAACRLSLKRPALMDAERDATKATELDSTYAKAFARLASARERLGDYPGSKENWQRALDVLPTTNPTTVEQIQRLQYEGSLKATTATMYKLERRVFRGDNDAGWSQIPPPWELAANVIRRMRSENPQNFTPMQRLSSAWIIHYAHKEFIEGVDSMAQNRSQNRSTVTKLAISNLTNGIMRDCRVIQLHGDLLTDYNRQMGIEAHIYRAWTYGGPELVIREALARQREEGWDAVRPAISVTIRVWIMKAFMSSGLNEQHEIAVEFYKNCLQVLRELGEHWRLESQTDCGVVFQDSFIFSVSNMYLDAIMKAADSDPSTELLELLREESNLLIHRVDAVLNHPSALPERCADLGMYSSFYVYPRGYAYAMQGFYYKKMSTRTGNYREEFSRKSALAYLIAVQCFPEDDEIHPWFLKVALENMLNAGSFSVRESLDVMTRIRTSVPRAKEIWARSSLGTNIWTEFETVTKEERKLRARVAQGKYTMDVCIRPQDIAL
ncbi:hypothetical protein C8F04DRAFT_1130485 [Mycena alexandri]|uniref:TPR-like protein n=1 Tax=Mycena alexandri TaxID=1745969 RepID=A0AAD6WRT9_9AGAR|nr:hypothetical protein C8F04DRAFT_1130485 [Mycena alexandri]